MQAGIHPEYTDTEVVCSCGHSFKTRSTYSADTLRVEICANCHPFFTGKQKLIDTERRVEVFNKKFKSFSTKKNAGSSDSTQEA